MPGYRFGHESVYSVTGEADIRQQMTTELARSIQNLDDPSLYINRELSWLAFNGRVLEEALDTRHPLLERVKFLSIFGSNLDEFFMIRVSGLRRQLESGVLEGPPDGMTPSEQLAEIRKSLLPQLDTMMSCYLEDLAPALAKAGVAVVPYDELKGKQRKLLRRHFKRQILNASGFRLCAIRKIAPQPVKDLIKGGGEGLKRPHRRYFTQIDRTFLGNKRLGFRVICRPQW